MREIELFRKFWNFKGVLDNFGDISRFLDGLLGETNWNFRINFEYFSGYFPRPTPVLPRLADSLNGLVTNNVQTHKVFEIKPRWRENEGWLNFSHHTVMMKKKMPPTKKNGKALPCP